MRALLLALLLLAVPATQSGCGASLAALVAHAVAIASEASGWVQAIADFVSASLDKVPDEGARKALAAAVQKARLAALALQDAARGADGLSKDDLPAAFAAFQSAYAELLELARPLGVHSVAPGKKYAAGPHELAVPPPEHFTIGAK